MWGWTNPSWHASAFFWSVNQTGCDVAAGFKVQVKVTLLKIVSH